MSPDTHAVAVLLQFLSQSDERLDIATRSSDEDCDVHAWYAFEGLESVAFLRMCAECEFGAFGLDGAFDGRLDHVVVVVQPREVNCEPPILLYLSVMGHEDRPGLVLGWFEARVCFGDDSNVVEGISIATLTRPYHECSLGSC